MPQPQRRWDDDSRLPPWLIQTLGAVLVVAIAVFWFFTDRVSPLLFSGAISLIGVGSVKAVAQNMLNRGNPVTLPPDDREPDDKP